MISNDKDKLLGFTEEFLSAAKEKVMCMRILDTARRFYSKPENVEAYKKWLAERNGSHEKN